MARTKQEIRDRIKSELGGWGVNVEIPDDDIEEFIDEAVDKISPYVNDTHYITVANKEGSAIDMSGRNIIDIVRVFPNYPVTSSHTQIDLFKVRDYSNMSDRMSLPMTISEIEDYINRNWKYDEQEEELYLDDYYGEITIEVIKAADLDNMKEQANINWVHDYALAMVKESLGRARGKYQVQGAPYEVDGRDLAQEGKDEKRELIDKLEQEGEGFFFVTR